MADVINLGEYSPSKLLFKIGIEYVLSCWLIYANEAKASLLRFAKHFSCFNYTLTFPPTLICVPGEPTGRERFSNILSNHKYVSLMDNPCALAPTLLLFLILVLSV